jgi:hypothetical protein
MPAQKHLIKKYANRKLYDTQTSRYITLDGISELVRDGHDIQVVDRETGRDLTPLILSQIVMSEEKRGGDANGAERGLERGQALLDYVRRTLSVPAAIVSGEVEKRRGDVEDLIDVAVEQALARLSIPSRREIESLNSRLDRLERRLEVLQGPARPNGRPKTAAKTTRTRKAAARS